MSQYPQADETEGSEADAGQERQVLIGIEGALKERPKIEQEPENGADDERDGADEQREVVGCADMERDELSDCLHGGFLLLDMGSGALREEYLFYLVSSIPVYGK